MLLAFALFRSPARIEAMKLLPHLFIVGGLACAVSFALTAVAGERPRVEEVRQHLSGLLAGTAPHHVGHNPLGALMMLTLMALVLALGLTGYLQTTDTFWGEEWLEELHEGLAFTLLWLAGLHAAAAIVLGRLEHTNLIGAMFTGIKVRRKP